MAGISSVGAVIIPVVVMRTGDKRALTRLKSELLAVKSAVKSMNAGMLGTGAAAAKSARGIKGFLKGMTNIRWALVNVALVVMTVRKAFDIFVKPIVELETEMVTVQKRTKMTSEAIAELENEILDLSRIIPGGATELAKIAAVAGQLGIRGSENILKFTETTAMMAASTVLSAEEAALAIAKISKAYELPISQAENMASVINELSNTTAANSKEISASVLKMAASANLLGISMEHASAISATLIEMGMRAERAGTRMKTTFTRMSTEAEKIAKLFGEGTTPLQIRDMIEEDANAAFTKIIEKLTQIESKTEAITIATEIFGRVGATAVLGLVTNYNLLRRSTISASIEFQKATSLQKEFDIAMATTTNQWSLYWQNFMASWEQAASSANKGFGGWLQNINTGNILLRNSNSLMVEFIDHQEAMGKEGGENLATIFKDGRNKAASRGSMARIIFGELTAGDVDKELEKFKKRISNFISAEDFTKELELQYRIQFFTEIGELELAKEEFKKFAESVSELTEVEKLSEEGIQSFIARLRVQQEVMNDTTNGAVAQSAALTEYNKIIVEINKQHQDDIDTILRLADATVTLVEAEEDLTRQMQFVYSFIKDKYSDAIKDLTKEYNAYKNVKFFGEEEELANLHRLDIALKQQKLSQLQLKEAVKETNDEFAKDEYSAWVETVDQFIKSTLENGRKLGKNVSSSIKQYQALLLSTDRFSIKSTETTEKESEEINELQKERDIANIEYELGIEEQHYKLNQFIKSLEQEGTVVASSASIVISMLSAKKDALDEMKSKQQEVVDEYDAMRFAAKMVSLEFDAATILALENLTLEGDGVDKLRLQYNELNRAKLGKSSTYTPEGNISGISPATYTGGDGREYITGTRILASNIGGAGDFWSQGGAGGSFADGGIISKPTIALIGEAGPEMVVPLTGPNAGKGLGGSTISIGNITITGVSGEPEDFANRFVTELKREMRTS